MAPTAAAMAANMSCVYPMTTVTVKVGDEAGGGAETMFMSTEGGIVAKTMTTAGTAMMKSHLSERMIVAGKVGVR